LQLSVGKSQLLVPYFKKVFLNYPQELKCESAASWVNFGLKIFHLAAFKGIIEIFSQILQLSVGKLQLRPPTFF